MYVQSDDEEDLDDIVIRPTDSLLLAIEANDENDVSILFFCMPSYMFDCFSYHTWISIFTRSTMQTYMYITVSFK